MNKNAIVAILTVALSAISNAVSAAQASGTVTMVQVPINASDQNSVYFKLNPMPATVTQWFYMRSGSATVSGCAVTTGEQALQRAYSALLAASASAQTVTVSYCLDANGYGLVNDYIRVTP